VQTFIPIPDLAASARVLDLARLNSQVGESLVVWKALAGNTAGWKNPKAWANHSTTRMWRGYDDALAVYHDTMLDEALRRGVAYKAPRWLARLGTWELPPWFGGPIHASHRAALLAKLPSHYGQFGWSETPGIQYVWPV